MIVNCFKEQISKVVILHAQGANRVTSSGCPASVSTPLALGSSGPLVGIPEASRRLTRVNWTPSLSRADLKPSGPRALPKDLGWTSYSEPLGPDLSPASVSPQAATCLVARDHAQGQSPLQEAARTRCRSSGASWGQGPLCQPGWGGGSSPEPSAQAWRAQPTSAPLTTLTCP